MWSIQSPISNNDHDDDIDNLSSLIDPSLLAGLSESERREALAAAAAAQRAERRAEERARQKKQSDAIVTIGANGLSTETIPTNAAQLPSLSEEEEEQRAYAQALEQRMKERQRERDAEKERLRSMMSRGGEKVFVAGSVINKGIVPNGMSAEEGVSTSGMLHFVSKKKRGMGQLLPPSTYGNGITPLMKKRENDNNTNQQQQQLQLQYQKSDSNTNNSTSQESHLTASQLASIKRAYLGEKAALFNEASTSPTLHASRQSSNATSQIRQQLREQRMKRRVKKATFKFEWGAEEDTFEDDDPLYGAAIPTTSGEKIYQQQQQRHTLHGKGTGGIIGRSLLQHDGEVKFGKKKMRSNSDAISTIHTVVTKPLDKMTPRDWRIYRENFNIVVKGGRSPPPLRSFREMPVGVPSIHPSLLDAIENKLQYKTPSPIQRQAIPIGMQRRDMIGIAETGR